MERKLPTENQEQKALFEWASFHPICKNYLIAIPNGGYRNKREARNLKLTGVKSGVSDIFLAYPSNPYHGLWIELKRKRGGRTSDSQNEWLQLMRDQSYCAEIAKGCDEAIQLINNYLGNNNA